MQHLLDLPITYDDVILVITHKDKFEIGIAASMPDLFCDFF